MRICAMSALATAIMAFAAPAFDQAKTETWIISGQSNAAGAGELPGPDSNPRVQMVDPASGKWIVAKEPLSLLSGQVGPWHAAAIDAAEASDVVIRLMGQTAGGNPIRTWDANAGGFATLAANIKKYGEGAGVFLWYQGESDAKSGMDEATYEAKLKDLVSRVRATAKNPSMLVVIVQIGIWPNGPGDYMPIREAARKFVIADGNALLVPALGRKGNLHLAKEGYFELGKEIARALLKVHYKRKDVDWPGPVMDAAVLASGGATVVAHFAETDKLSGVDAGDFAVQDAAGTVKCLEAQADNTRVSLTLERAVKLPAKLIYGFGQAPKAALVDEAGNRAPAVQMELTVGAAPANKITFAPNGAGGKSGH